MSCDEISFGYLEYPPSSGACFPVFSKTLKCSGEISPFLTEGSNHDSVALIMSGLCRLFSTSMSAALFLMLWLFMRIHRKFGLFFCL